MLLDQYTPLLQAKSRDDLLKEVLSFTNRLGFDKANAMVVVDHFHAEPEFLSVNNTPVELCEVVDNKDVGRLDPVMQHCKRNSIPIIWNQETYIEAGRAEQWEIQARFGYHVGIALALHLPESRHFVISVDRDQALPSSPAELARMTAYLQLFAAHAQAAALHVLLLPTPQPDMPTLTARELESLRWTMDGKTAWEVGAILGISEQTAARHVSNATQKLGCVNKLQAVVKALRLGLIH